MRFSRYVLALGVALVANVVLAVLLSPLGFESRPSAELTSVGYVAIATVFAGLVADVASIVLLLLQRVRPAARLAIVGSILFLFPNLADQMRVFFALPAPPVINALEYVFIVVLLLTLALAWQVHRASSHPTSRDA